MSMHEYPNGGWVVTVDEFIKALLKAGKKELNKDDREEIKTVMNNGDEATIGEMIEKICKKLNWPLPDVFSLMDEDFSEDLEYGKIYVAYCLRDLYEVKPLPILKTMEKAGAKFEEASWTRFG